MASAALRVWFAVLVSILPFAADAASYQRMLIPVQPSVTIAHGDTGQLASFCLDQNRDAPSSDDTYSAVYASPGAVKVTFGKESMTLEAALTASPPLARITGSETGSHVDLRIENLDPRGRPMTVSVKKRLILAAKGDAVGDILPFVENHQKEWAKSPPVKVGSPDLERENERLWDQRLEYARTEIQSWAPNLPLHYEAPNIDNLKGDVLAVAKLLNGMAEQARVGNDILALANLKAVAADLKSRGISNILPFVLVQGSDGYFAVVIKDGRPQAVRAGVGEMAADLLALQDDQTKPAGLFLVGNVAEDTSYVWRSFAHALEVDLVNQTSASQPPLPVPSMPRSGIFADNLLGEFASPEQLKGIRRESYPPPEAYLVSDPDAWAPLAEISGNGAGIPPGPPPTQASSGTPPPPPRLPAQRAGTPEWRAWTLIGRKVQVAWRRSKEWLVVGAGKHASLAATWLIDRLSEADPPASTLPQAIIIYEASDADLRQFLNVTAGPERPSTVTLTFWRGQVMGFRHVEREEAPTAQKQRLAGANPQ